VVTKFNAMKFLGLVSAALFLLCASSCGQRSNVYSLNDYGVSVNDTTNNATVTINNAIERILSEVPDGTPVVLTLEPGRYDFYPDSSMMREYYISNHDQVNPKMVGIALENLKNVTLDGNGADLMFHGRMLPVSLVSSRNCTIKNLDIDFVNPHISQITVVDNDTVRGIIRYKVAPWVRYEIRDSAFVAIGDGWEHIPDAGIAFEADTKRLVYNTSDISVGVRGVKMLSDSTIEARWHNPRLIPGTVVALRTYGRPAPGIFVDDDINVTLENISVHYAEGMGLLAQGSENIYLKGFNVCLRGDNDPRYFTTQADATHFSGCKGVIVSEDGLYENMMDDAINVHGTYLKVVDVIDSCTILGRYMHPQAFGFSWGNPGDTIQFISSRTMELVGEPRVISEINPVDTSCVAGAKVFNIKLTAALPDDVDFDNGEYGVENLEWTPSVHFAGNVVRNNRARGALFSTPRTVLVENNLFDHTSGTAILLCGDCNGWFETGACRDVTIRDNRFENALTSMFQFTNAVISIYPEIPDLEHQQKYFHSNILIENNVFDTFDTPLLYAKSVDGLKFINNEIRRNNEYPAYHWNKQPVLLERVVNSEIQIVD